MTCPTREQIEAARLCGCPGIPGAKHLPPCSQRGRTSGPSGKHVTPRGTAPEATLDACVELGEALGVHWHDAPAEALRLLTLYKAALAASPTPPPSPSPAA
jgi:hypothetical protein